MPELELPYNQFSPHDEKILERIVSGINGVICEVGCWTGHSTSILARRAKELKNLMIVIDNFMGNDGTPLIDYARDNDVKSIFVNNMKELDLWNNILLLESNSFDAYKTIRDGSLSMIFIDAGHTYRDVSRDLVSYLPKLEPGGMICGHDYESDTYDERYINEDYVDGKHHGVIKAVNEIFGKVNHDGRMWWLELKNY